MEHLNHTLFLIINAPLHPSAAMLAFATFWAEHFILLMAPAFVLAWLRGTQAIRIALLQASGATLAALAINQLIGMAWQHPRPFMIGEGHTWLAHVADSSFPSDHLTVIWAVAFSLLWRPVTRKAGMALALLGLPVAWARIYLGVHYPLDMPGAAMVAYCSAALLFLAPPQRYLARTVAFATRIHRHLFARWIARGWIRN